MWLMRSFFVSLPRELEESAMIDGCTRYGAFFKIIVPISNAWPSLHVIFSMILAGKNFSSRSCSQSHASTIPWPLRHRRRHVNGANWAALTAVGTITVVPVVIFATACQKWLIQGLADGATKVRTERQWTRMDRPHEPPRRFTTKSDIAHERIKQMILSGESSPRSYLAGRNLPKACISETPIREAILALAPRAGWK